MKKYKKTLIESYAVSDVKCNRCGKSIPKSTDFLSVEKRWGYGTSLDNTEHSFDICEDCYKHIVADFKIPPVADNIKL
jgi:ribosomal-protein-alanine N-acetyltransferase